MRTLTANARTSRSAADNIQPVIILKVEWGGAIGTKYYADQAVTVGGAGGFTTVGRLADPSQIAMLLNEGEANPIDDVQVTLADADKTLFGYLFGASSTRWHRRRVTVYQHFAGNTSADLVPLLVGIIDAAPAWNESDATVTLEVTDISQFRDKTVGTLATRSEFPGIDENHEDRVLPQVYGAMRRVSCVLVAGGARTALVHEMDRDDTVLYVNNSQRFPQSIPTTIWVGDELISGTFDGNTFTVDERGVVVATEKLTRKTPGPVYTVLTFGGCADVREYLGYYAVLAIDGSDQARRIIHADPANKTVTIHAPFITPEGDQKELMAGTTIRIGTIIDQHPVGAEVRQALEDYVYVVADHPVKAIHRVEVRGMVSDEVDPFPEDFIPDFLPDTLGDKRGIDMGVTTAHEEWIEVPEGLYKVNTNDTGVTDHAVATVTFKRLPRDLHRGPVGNTDLYADVDGVCRNQTHGTLWQNPAAVIRDVLKRLGGLEDSDIDTSSFAAVEGSIGLKLRFAFAMAEQRNLLSLLSDLAFQARCSLTFEGGLARLTWLRNRAGVSVLTISDAMRGLSSFELSSPDREEVITEIKARWTQAAEPKHLSVRDMALEADYERRTREIDFWAYQRRWYVHLAASFWLARWTQARQRVKLATFLRALELERHDCVTLNLTGLMTDQKAEVMRIGHQPGSGDANRIDDVELELRLPRGAGCSLACELACETGCEGDCELSCQTGCQASCEWRCESECEVGCQIYCTTGCTLFCQNTCQAGGCTTDCEVNCQSGCEANACESNGCESSCTRACEVFDCESQCESGDCETGCEAACQSDACETACESDTCESDCTLAACESTCESGACQSGPCEGACESDCTMSCESGCETYCECCCEFVCESDCQSFCECSCQTGCTSACEASGGCETSCTTTCETDCQCLCENRCESCCEHLVQASEDCSFYDQCSSEDLTAHIVFTPTCEHDGACEEIDVTIPVPRVGSPVTWQTDFDAGGVYTWYFYLGCGGGDKWEAILHNNAQPGNGQCASDTTTVALSCVDGHPTGSFDLVMYAETNGGLGPTIECGTAHITLT